MKFQDRQERCHIVRENSARQPPENLERDAPGHGIYRSCVSCHQDGRLQLQVARLRAGPASSLPHLDQPQQASTFQPRGGDCSAVAGGAQAWPWSWRPKPFRSPLQAEVKALGEGTGLLAVPGGKLAGLRGPAAASLTAARAERISTTGEGQLAAAGAAAPCLSKNRASCAGRQQARRPQRCGAKKLEAKRPSRPCSSRGSGVELLPRRLGEMAGNRFPGRWRRKRETTTSRGARAKSGFRALQGGPGGPNSGGRGPWRLPA